MEVCRLHCGLGELRAESRVRTVGFLLCDKLGVGVIFVRYHYSLRFLFTTLRWENMTAQRRSDEV